MKRITVFCLTYNHEKYIKQTLEGFVKQKTTFPFKVIVHDDASTDNTASIITEYAKNYPDLIVPIIQKENQFSKKVRIFSAYIQPLLEGDYIAMCEGDDYWTDENKLQIQFDYMENNPQCSLCVHNTKRINEKGEDLNAFFNESAIDKNYTVDEIILAEGGGLFHFSSCLIRKSLKLSLPNEFIIKGIGDYPQAIWAALNGEVHYIAKVMSAYRQDSVGSWSERNKDNNTRAININNLISGLKRINECTKYKYNKSFVKIINKRVLDLYITKRQFLKILIHPELYGHLFSKIIGKLKNLIGR